MVWFASAGRSNVALYLVQHSNAGAMIVAALPMIVSITLCVAVLIATFGGEPLIQGRDFAVILVIVLCLTPPSLILTLIPTATIFWLLFHEDAVERTGYFAITAIASSNLLSAIAYVDLISTSPLMSIAALACGTLGALASVIIYSTLRWPHLEGVVRRWGARRLRGRWASRLKASPLRQALDLEPFVLAAFYIPIIALSIILRWIDHTPIYGSDAAWLPTERIEILVNGEESWITGQVVSVDETGVGVLKDGLILHLQPGNLVQRVVCPDVQPFYPSLFTFGARDSDEAATAALSVGINGRTGCNEIPNRAHTPSKWFDK
jgi:hypothetical protein